MSTRKQLFLHSRILHIVDHSLSELFFIVISAVHFAYNQILKTLQDPIPCSNNNNHKKQHKQTLLDRRRHTFGKSVIRNKERRSENL